MDAAAEAHWWNMDWRTEHGEGLRFRVHPEYAAEWAEYLTEVQNPTLVILKKCSPRGIFSWLGKRGLSVALGIMGNGPNGGNIVWGKMGIWASVHSEQVLPAHISTWGRLICIIQKYG